MLAMPADIKNYYSESCEYRNFLPTKFVSINHCIQAILHQGVKEVTFFLLFADFTVVVVTAINIDMELEEKEKFIQLSMQQPHI